MTDATEMAITNECVRRKEIKAAAVEDIAAGR
jgi:hypothetical protein